MRVRASAPGRVNLIGEHTDYNQGLVMPVAVDMHTTVEARKGSGRRVRVSSLDFGLEGEFSLDGLEPPASPPSWLDYLKGACWVLEGAGYTLGGAVVAVRSTVPVGAGLSSSAALELAAAAALCRLNGHAVGLRELALLCQKAENEFVGVRCGIMDQFASALGRAGQALLLDCRSLELTYIPLELKGCRLLVIDSRVERTLGASAYNRRREECAALVEKLSAILGRALESLREVSLEEIRAARPFLPEVLYRRGRFVVEENIRVAASAEALRDGDWRAFGYFMKRSHAGLRDLYAVSCAELDLVVDVAAACPGVWGSRMTGAGFGGCAVALVENGAVAETEKMITGAFARRGWREPRFYCTGAAPGLSVEVM